MSQSVSITFTADDFAGAVGAIAAWLSQAMQTHGPAAPAPVAGLEPNAPPMPAPASAAPADANAAPRVRRVRGPKPAPAPTAPEAPAPAPAPAASNPPDSLEAYAAMKKLAQEVYELKGRDVLTALLAEFKAQKLSEVTTIEVPFVTNRLQQLLSPVATSAATPDIRDLLED